jgi:hypothetical protein
MIPDALVGGTKGLLGMNVDPNESNAGYTANALTQLGSAGEGMLKAGLPLMSLTKGKPIFHGTKHVFEKFNPELNDIEDTLGWMIHGTSDPEYASSYAMGTAKHGSSGNPNIFAMKPEAKNTLDLVDPNLDDLSQALASMSFENKKNTIMQFKRARKDPWGEARIFLNKKHYPEGIHNIPEKEIPLRILAERLKLNQEEFNKSPFDAIRYHDMSHESYAIKPGTPIQSAYGAPLTENPNQLKVIRHEGPYTGTNELVKSPTKSQEAEGAIQQMYSNLNKVPTSKLVQQTKHDFSKSSSSIAKQLTSVDKPKYDILTPGLVNKAKAVGINANDFNSFNDLSNAYFKKTGSSIYASK